MAIQIKRQGGGATSTAAAASPSSLNYGELACASNGDLYVGNGSRKPVGVVTTNGNKNISGTMRFSNSTTFHSSVNFRGANVFTGATTFSNTARFTSGTTFTQGINVGARNHQETYNVNFAKPSSYTYSGHLDCAMNNFRIYGQTASGSTTIAVQAYLGKGTVQLIDNNGDSSFPGRLILKTIEGGSWIDASHVGAITNPNFTTESAGNYVQSYVSMKTKNGSWALAALSGYNDLYLVYGTDSNYNAGNNTTNTAIRATPDGYLYASRVYNAVYNDYAEYFPRGEQTEPGDIIALDVDSEEEKYIIAKKGLPIIGVHSNEYAHIIGGEEKAIDGGSTEEYNIKKYIPVGLCGRCKVKTIGPIKKGDKIVISDVPGVGRAYCKETDSIEDYINSIGIAVENQPIDDDKIRLVRVKLK